MRKITLFISTKEEVLRVAGWTWRIEPKRPTDEAVSEGREFANGLANFVGCRFAFLPEEEPTEEK